MLDNVKSWDLTFGIKRKINRENWGSTCPKGHEWTEENTYWLLNAKPYPKRQCRLCAKERKQRKCASPEGKAYEAAKMRKWRAANEEKNRQQYTDNRKRKKEWLDSQKVACKICGDTRTPCLDFHHRNPEDKKVNLSLAYAHWSIKRLEVEVAKCDIICASCHRLLHFNERNR